MPKNNQTAPIIKPIYLVLVITILFYCLDFFFRISPGLVVGQMMQQYQTNALGIGSLASAFYLGYVMFQVPAGMIYDRFPLNRILIVSILICTLAYLGFIYETHYWVGWLTRWIVGLTSSFSFIGALYIARAYLPLRYFDFISGVTIAGGTLSASFAQIISAYFMQYYGWHTIFTVLALWGIVISVLLMLPALQVNRLQILSRNQNSLQFRELLKQFFALLKQPNIMINSIVGGLFYLPTSIFAALWGISFLESQYNLTKTSASTAIMLLFAGWAVGAPLLAWGNHFWRDPRRLILVGAVLGAILSLLILYANHEVGSWIYLSLFIFGLCSSTQVVVWIIFGRICPKEISGTGIALTNMMIMLAGGIFHILVGWLMIQPSHLNPAIIHANFSLGLAIIPIALFIAAILANFIRLPQPPDEMNRKKNAKKNATRTQKRK